MKQKKRRLSEATDEEIIAYFIKKKKIPHFRSKIYNLGGVPYPQNYDSMYSQHYAK
jgi:hypothetical protein